MVHSNQLPPVADGHVNDEEIDLIGLFRSILGTWRPLVLSLIIVSIVFGAVKSFQIAFLATESTYSKPIRMTFPNAHKLVFPSGARFAYSDIVAPAVAQIAFERNKLNEFGLTIADLQGGLSCSPYAPTYPLIIEKYEKLMSDKKLTVEQLTELQKRMDAEIEQATSGEALITLRLEKKELPKVVVEKVLSDIPAIWAERAMKDKGVLDANAQLATVNSLNAELIRHKEGLLAGDLLQEKLDLLRKNITALKGFEGAQSVADPVTGMRLLDLSFAINDLGRYVIGDLISPLRELGLSRDIKSSTYYYQDKYNKLKITMAAQQREVAAFKDAYNSYVQYEHVNTDVKKDGQLSSSVVIPQLNTDMLDKLVGLSGEAAREKYKQQLNSEIFELTKEIAYTESALTDAQQVLTILQKNAASGGKLSTTDEQYLAKAESGIPQVITKIQDFFGVSDRIYRQLSIESVGIRDQLYVPVTNTILAKKIILDVKSTILIWLALLFLTTVVVVPSVLIKNALNAKKIEQ